MKCLVCFIHVMIHSYWSLLTNSTNTKPAMLNALCWITLWEWLFMPSPSQYSLNNGFKAYHYRSTSVCVFL